MKTKIEKLQYLKFDMHQLNSAINNLNFSLILNENIECENTQHYIKRLIEILEEINFNNYLNK